MATYIEDEETSILINKYAELMNTSKTGALRELLRREIGQANRLSTSSERYNRIMEWLGPPISAVEEIPKQHYDWLAGDTEAAEMSDTLKKELGVVTGGR